MNCVKLTIFLTLLATSPAFAAAGDQQLQDNNRVVTGDKEIAADSKDLRADRRNALRHARDTAREKADQQRDERNTPPATAPVTVR